VDCARSGTSVLSEGRFGLLTATIYIAQDCGRGGWKRKGGKRKTGEHKENSALKKKKRRGYKAVPLGSI